MDTFLGILFVLGVLALLFDASTDFSRGKEKYKPLYAALAIVLGVVGFVVGVLLFGSETSCESLLAGNVSGSLWPCVQAGGKLSALSIALVCLGVLYLGWRYLHAKKSN
jgi:hypothetical protein